MKIAFSVRASKGKNHDGGGEREQKELYAGNREVEKHHLARLCTYDLNLNCIIANNN